MRRQRQDFALRVIVLWPAWRDMEYEGGQLAGLAYFTETSKAACAELRTRMYVTTSAWREWGSCYTVHPNSHLVGRAVSLNDDADNNSRSIISHTHARTHARTHTHTRLMALFPGLPGWASTRKAKPIWTFTEARDSEWQWHQLGHMQVCTLLQTDNHASTPPLSFLQDGCPSCRPTNSVRALKAWVDRLSVNW